MEIRCIHYGSSSFDPSKFKPIKDSEGFMGVKPRGGLWASPVNAEYGWVDWCKDNDYANGSLLESFELTVVGNILVIDSKENLDLLPWVDNDRFNCFISFETLVKAGYDAIHLTGRGEDETRYCFPKSLSGWDCESVLVLNKSSIII